MWMLIKACQDVSCQHEAMFPVIEMKQIVGIALFIMIMNMNWLVLKRNL